MMVNVQVDIRSTNDTLPALTLYLPILLGTSGPPSRQDRTQRQTGTSRNVGGSSRHQQSPRTEWPGGARPRDPQPSATRIHHSSRAETSMMELVPCNPSETVVGLSVQETELSFYGPQVTEAEHSSSRARDLSARSQRRSAPQGQGTSLRYGSDQEPTSQTDLKYTYQNPDYTVFELDEESTHYSEKSPILQSSSTKRAKKRSA